MEKNQIELSGNKYFTWYWNICNCAKDRILPEGIYIERHHIYPKSIYGQNKDLVKLTAKEHYIVHLLLWWGLRTKFGTQNTKTVSMAGAFDAINMKNDNTQGRYNSNLYEFLRIAYSEFNKERSKGINNSMYGTCAYKIWIEKYGQEEADKRKTNMNQLQGLHKEKNGNFGKGYYKIWIEKYGQEEADKMEKNRIEKNIKSNKGKHNKKYNYIERFGEEKAEIMNKQKSKKLTENNPMKKHSVYEWQILKYGKKEADFRQAEQRRKRKETMKLNKIIKYGKLDSVR